MVNFVSVNQFSESHRFLSLSCQNKPVYCNEGNNAAALEATRTLLVVRLLLLLVVSYRIQQEKDNLLQNVYAYSYFKEGWPLKSASGALFSKMLSWS